MNVQSASARPAAYLSLTRPALAFLVGAGVLVGALTGAAIATGVEQAGHAASTARPHVLGPGTSFDAVAFRAEERDFAPAPTFDAVAFRAGERDFAPAPTFDAVTFRAQERAAMTTP